MLLFLAGLAGAIGAASAYHLLSNGFVVLVAYGLLITATLPMMMSLFLTKQRESLLNSVHYHQVIGLSCTGSLYFILHKVPPLYSAAGLGYAFSIIVFALIRMTRHHHPWIPFFATFGYLHAVIGLLHAKYSLRDYALSIALAMVACSLWQLGRDRHRDTNQIHLKSGIA